MRVFLSHSAANPVSDVRHALISAGVEVVDAYDPRGHNEFFVAVTEAIAQCDAFIAVIDGTSPNVFYELGLAKASTKATLVLQRPDTVLPPFLADTYSLTTDFRDSKALRFTITQFLKQLDKDKDGGSKSRALRSTMPVSEKLASLGRQIRELRDSGSPSKAESTLASFLKAAHVRVVERGADDHSDGADLAIWSDGISSTIGNPVLIELKIARLEQMNFRVAYSNLASAVQAGPASAGLLLYMDRTGRRFDRPNTSIPTVFFCDLDDFASRVLALGFDRTLLDLRNEHVHGDAR